MKPHQSVVKDGDRSVLTGEYGPGVVKMDNSGARGTKFTGDFPKCTGVFPGILSEKSTMGEFPALAPNFRGSSWGYFREGCYPPVAAIRFTGRNAGYSPAASR